MRWLASALEISLILGMLPLAGCDSDTGPADVKFGRDVCEMCGMIISDPRFVTEVRLGDRSLHKFDDVGDAVNWLSAGCKVADDIKEFWVMDSANGKTWLDARQAFYRHAETPMNYGFGAVATQTPGTISFADMREQVLRPQNACKSPQAADGGHYHHSNTGH